MKDPIELAIAKIQALEVMEVSKIDRVYNQALHNAIAVVKGMPSAEPELPEPEELDFVQPHKKIGVQLEIGRTEIIRCGQCKYAEMADPEDSQDGYTCQFHRGSIWFSGSFCSWAERREK